MKESTHFGLLDADILHQGVFKGTWIYNTQSNGRKIISLYVIPKILTKYNLLW